MKKIFVMAMLACAAVAFSAGSAHAFSLGIGGSLWYAWWKPAFEDWTIDKANPYLPPVWSRFTMNPRLAYMPVLTMKFSDRINWTNALLIGRYESGMQAVKWNPPTQYFSTKSRNTILKYDYDSLLNITLNKYLSLFPGFKYQRYSYNNHRYIFMFSVDFNDKVIFNSYSLGLGLGFNVNLVDNLFLLYNISGLYQAILQEKDGKVILFRPPYIKFSLGEGTTMNNGWGGNTTISLAYYVPKASLTFSAGFRYQVFYYLNSSMGKGTYSITENRYDHFYGVIFSVIYTLDFSKFGKKNETDG